MKTQDMNAKGEGMKPTRDELNDWLRDQILCVLSTLDETGAPKGTTASDQNRYHFATNPVNVTSS